MEWTNREEFCISCHEMKDNVSPNTGNTIRLQPLRRAGHLARTATCQAWGPKMIRKMRPPKDLHKVPVPSDTPRSSGAKRLELAEARVGPDEADRFPRVPQLPATTTSFDYA